MLINFSVQNFGSIKEKQTLSFEADKSKQLEDHYVIHTNGLRLLKLALIYGANASGKTTVLNALRFLRETVLYPKTEKIHTFRFEPFLFDSDTPKQNTFFNLDFIQNDVRYLYEIELNKNVVVRENLSYAKNPNNTKKIVNVFERTTDTEKQITRIAFSKTKIDEIGLKTLTANTLSNNSVLGGFLKTNIELSELTDVINWFQEYLQWPIYPHNKLDRQITERIDQNEIDKIEVLNILKKADFNLSDIIIRKTETENTLSIWNAIGRRNLFEDNTQEIANAKKITSFNLDFEHTVKGNPFSLSFRDQSQGTQRYYGIAGLLYLLITKSTAFPIDELESSLHPDLFQHFLLSFLVNSKNSQLIATTHNREILNNRDIFRNDAIWITDKDNEDCATELYSLADFDTKVIRDTTNVLNAFKLGKLGGIPNLGSYYININDENK